MLELLNDYKGQLTVNGVLYNSITAVVQELKDYVGELTIVLGRSNTGTPKNNVQSNPVIKVNETAIYKIKVRQYMIKKPTKEFDFHDKWNKGTPMPMRIMVGKVLEETKGMVKMELWGEIMSEETSHCMKCCKVLTNPVSRYFGIGPECGGHNYVNPFDTDEELKEAVGEMRQQLRETKWVGWIIKSAIEEKEIIRKEVE